MIENAITIIEFLKKILDIIKSDSKKSAAIIDEIRCDEKEYLIWKWHPKGTEAGESSRENAIRFGSMLRVKENEVVVFIYNHHGEQIQDYIEGPFDHVIATSNLPFIADFLDKIYKGGTPFPAEIYYINMAKMLQMRFAVPYFDVFDRKYQDIAVPVAVRGNFNFRISDCKAFVKIHGLNNFDIGELQKRIRAAISRCVKTYMNNMLEEYNISILQIESKIGDITEKIEQILCPVLNKEFAIEILRVDITAIEIDKFSEGYNELKRKN